MHTYLYVYIVYIVSQREREIHDMCVTYIHTYTHTLDQCDAQV